MEPGPFVRLFVEEAPAVMNTRLAVNRCLNATRICVEVMRAFNVRAAAISVGMMAYNREYFAKLTKHGDLPDRALLDTWIAEGAWGLAIDTTPERTDRERNAWGGHLVAIVQDAWLVDGASMQFNRPEKGISFPEVFVARATADFLKGRKAACFKSKEGALLTYRARLDDQSWEALDGYQLSGHNVDVIVEIVNRMAARLGRKAPMKLQA